MKNPKVGPNSYSFLQFSQHMTYKLTEFQWKYVLYAKTWVPISQDNKEEEKNASRLGEAWSTMVQSIAKVRCLVCEGFGHSTKTCPTRARLMHMCGGSGVFKTIRN